jgi:hypothetical protein
VLEYCYFWSVVVSGVLLFLECCYFWNTISYYFLKYCYFWNVVIFRILLLLECCYLGTHCKILRGGIVLESHTWSLSWKAIHSTGFCHVWRLSITTNVVSYPSLHHDMAYLFNTVSCIHYEVQA